MSPSHSFSACVGAAWILAAAGTFGPASAQDISEPEVEKGQNKIEAFSEFQSGFNGGRADDTRQSHNISYSRGLTDFWQIKGYFVAQEPARDDLRVTHFALENTFEIVRAKNFGGIGLAWFASVATSLHDEETNIAQFGPIVRLGAGPTSLVLNPFFEKTFGRNAEEGLAFVYGWQIKHEMRKGMWLGLEGFGRLPDIDGAGGPDEHRIGPIATFEWQLADKRTLTFETGVQFGLTDATPDRALKFKLSYAY
jgi:hypothetical protein